MRTMIVSFSLVVGLICPLIDSAYAQTDAEINAIDLSPSSLVISSDGNRLYVAEQTAEQFALVDVEKGEVVKTLSLPAESTGLALSADDRTLYITCAEPAGRVCVLDTQSLEIIKTIPAGYGVCSPVLSPSNERLFLCNRFENTLSVFDLQTNDPIIQIPLAREPIAAVLTHDGRFLFVAHHLPYGPSDADFISATVSIVDAMQFKVVKEISLLNGSTNMRGICISADGRYVFVPHILARYQMPTFQLERGWMNTNALSIIDVETQDLLNTVLLDDVDHGAANPWDVACSPDGQLLCVSHAGTHELSVIRWPALLEQLIRLRESKTVAENTRYSAASVNADDVPNDLSFLAPFRRRIPITGNGPRALAIAGSRVFVANYFSDNLSVIELGNEQKWSESTIPLGRNLNPTLVRRGEMLFHDARLCFQKWQSCASCHPDGRVDGLNWDLLNDGVGNPKNTKSLLLSHQTPPAMGTGVRADAEAAVRSGIRHILFLERPEQEAVAIDEYLKAMRPLPSPFLENGNLSEAARRGEEIFHRAEVGCASCHGGALYTDLQSYDVGTRGKFGKHDVFDTPTLIELWRTAPYLHDGSAAAILDILTTGNRDDKHGRTSHLTPEELADLEVFLKSL